MRIDFNFVLGNLASGNYSGSIDIIGRINDGAGDLNITKKVIVSTEVYFESNKLEIYPKFTNITANQGAFCKEKLFALQFFLS